MTPLNIGVFLLSLAGFVALAAGMSKHAKHLLRRELPPAVSRLLRALGWLLLAAALAIGIRQWHADVGLVTWLGWLPVVSMPSWSCSRGGVQPGPAGSVAVGFLLRRYASLALTRPSSSGCTRGG